MTKEEHIEEVMLPSATPQHAGLAAPARQTKWVHEDEYSVNQR